MIDDVLVFAASQEEHDSRLRAVLLRLEEAGATLNVGKCEFDKKKVKFLGHIIDKDGIRADPEKTSALVKMAAPQSVSDLRRFMGLANQLGKFSPHLGDISQPMRELLRSGRAWVRGHEQEKSFSAVKQALVKPTVLALYNPQAKTKISADASSFGMGAVLMQLDGQTWKPVAYASRTLSDMEKRYAQIEKQRPGHARSSAIMFWDLPFSLRRTTSL